MRIGNLKSINDIQKSVIIKFKLNDVLFLSFCFFNYILMQRNFINIISKP